LSSSPPSPPPRKRSAVTVGILFLAGATLLWAGNAVVARALKDEASGVALSFWRWTIALAVMLPFVAGSLRGKWPVIRARWKYLAFCGWAGTAPNNAIVFAALKHTTAINVQLFNSVIPVWVLLVTWLAFKNKPTAGEGWGVTVSLLGVVVIVTQGELGRLVSFELNQADLWVLGTFFFWGVYSAVLRYRPFELTAFEFSCVTGFIGTLMLIPFYAWEFARGGTLPAFSWALVAGIAYLAIGTSILAGTFYSAGIDRLGPSRGSLFIHLVPVFGIALSVFFLGEVFGWYHALGFALVLAGLGIANRRRAPEAQAG
jgi:drug/metabolite transporter (DMT)-like permease